MRANFKTLLLFWAILYWAIGGCAVCKAFETHRVREANVSAGVGVPETDEQTNSEISCQHFLEVILINTCSRIDGSVLSYIRWNSSRLERRAFYYVQPLPSAFLEVFVSNFDIMFSGQSISYPFADIRENPIPGNLSRFIPVSWTANAGKPHKRSLICLYSKKLSFERCGSLLTFRPSVVCKDCQSERKYSYEVMRKIVSISDRGPDPIQKGSHLVVLFFPGAAVLLTIGFGLVATGRSIPLISLGVLLSVAAVASVIMPYWLLS